MGTNKGHLCLGVCSTQGGQRETCGHGVMVASAVWFEWPGGSWIGAKEGEQWEAGGDFVLHGSHRHDLESGSPGASRRMR